jgi:hypothetical protein
VTDPVADDAAGSTDDGTRPSDATPAARVARVLVYPVKSLDPHPVERTRVVGDGGLRHDREYAMVDADGDYVNGKRERAVHRLRSEFEPDGPTLSLSGPGFGPESYRLPTEDDPGDRDALTDRLSDYFGYRVELRRDAEGGFPDDTTLSGPTVTSTATLREVASWFADRGVDVDGTRRRFRANVELGPTTDGTGDADAETPTDPLPAFFEDRLFADRGAVVPFSLGGVTLEGVNPCQRCVVPSRDPDTGAELDGFRETFVRRREATLPAWTRSDRFDHPFRLMVNTRVPRESVGESFGVGDAVRVGDVRPA